MKLEERMAQSAKEFRSCQKSGRSTVVAMVFFFLALAISASAPGATMPLYVLLPISCGVATQITIFLGFYRTRVKLALLEELARDPDVTGGSQGAGVP